MTTPMQPVILTRNDVFLDAYNEWKKSQRKTDVLNTFKTIYEASFFGDGDVRCDILRQPQYNMLVLHYGDDFWEDDFTFLMDHIQEVLLTNGYSNYMSDRKKITLDGGTKQDVERHYLKPSIYNPPTDSGQIDRKFGNITIEVFFEETTPQILKLTCNYYSDRLMQKEQGIDRLMEAIFAR
jgi:hypothetical protein